RIVVRVSKRYGLSWVEIACFDAAWARECLDAIEADALKHSFLRGKLFEMRFQQQSTDDYGYWAQSPGLQIHFRPDKVVTDEDIVLDADVAQVLKRNVFDCYHWRERLLALGLPRKRALLFYGPPGTGKTYTCRYIHSRLPAMTTILVTGHSLGRIDDVCGLARQLQPTLVIVEDVDLIFTQREINLYSTALGDFMDQLDGFKPDEEIFFILTTNAIDRVEQAIKDRPGRINQCIHFGTPNPDLRRQYLARQLASYDHAAVDHDRLVATTEGASQAFLKEYVFRAVQIAAERQGYENSAPIALLTEDFDAAKRELTSDGDVFSRSILGFHGERR
ncbi:MAG: AAA family ATPase, partial [Planctomycetia bacterium]